MAGSATHPDHTRPLLRDAMPCPSAWFVSRKPSFGFTLPPASFTIVYHSEKRTIDPLGNTRPPSSFTGVPSLIAHMSKADGLELPQSKLRRYVHPGGIVNGVRTWRPGTHRSSNAPPKVIFQSP